jgi:hypothetical protein
MCAGWSKIYAEEFTACGARARLKQSDAGRGSGCSRSGGVRGWLPLLARHVPRWRLIRPSAGHTDGQGPLGQVVDGRFGAESLGCISVAVQRGRRVERSSVASLDLGLWTAL